MIPKGSKLLDHLSPDEKVKYLEEREAKKIEQANAQKVLRRFTKHIKSLGYIRTKPTFWVREQTNIVQFIHIHKYTFGPCFRIHTCLRPHNSSLEFIALTGPTEKELSSNVSFEYTNKTDSIDQCAIKMSSFVQRQSEEWYEKWSRPSSLIGALSPLNEKDQSGFKQSLEGNSNSKWVRRTKDLLKIV
ncbi:hypothetical protein P4S81_12480 [Pseudoalteromonas sp. B28]